MFKAFHNGTIYTGNQVLHKKAVLVSNGTIDDIVDDTAIPEAYEKEDLNGNGIAPSFIDLQIYGGNGKLFSEDLSVEAIHATHDYCVNGGASHFMITMATNSIDRFLKGMELVREYWDTGGKGLLGLHLEGPYLNPLKKGAHVERFIRQPTIAEVQMLLDKGKDVFKMMTLAPEQCDESVIALLQRNNILVSAGHSNATYQQGTHAFDNGIPTATHLFNAMSALQHRAPGMVGAIYDHSKAMCSLVCDGVHVDFAAVRISKKIMQDRLFFITDAVAETTTGDYIHVYKGDRYTLPDGTLSGSALTMMQCVRNAVRHVGISLEESLRMAALYPAKLLGDGCKLGKIDKGYEASFVIFDKQLDTVRIV
jgi:N-acetylglucosamine-6-phosphate deacetylase